MDTVELQTIAELIIEDHPEAKLASKQFDIIVSTLKRLGFTPEEIEENRLKVAEEIRKLNRRH